MYLTEIETLRSYLRRNVKIETGERDPEDGSLILKEKIDYPVFAVIRNAYGTMKDLEAEAKTKKFDGTDEEREAKQALWIKEQQGVYDGIAGAMRISSGSAVATMDSFYLVPLYIGMTEVRYLEYFRDKGKSEDQAVDRIVLNPNPLFTIPEDSFKGGEDFKIWADCPVMAFDKAAAKMGEPYNLECVLKFKQISDTVAQLESVIKSLDIIKKNRIAMGNSITNSAFTRMGKKAYDEMKAEFPKDVEYIDMAYEEFKDMVNSRPISKTTGEKTEINVRTFYKVAKELNAKFITTFVMFTRMKAYDMQLKTEKFLKRSIEDLVVDHPYWKYFLKGVRGCGTLHAGYIIGLLDPTVCRHPSGFLRYLGLDVVDNGEGRMVGRNKKYTRVLPFVNKDNEVQMNNSRGYNAKMKSRIWLLCDNMIKAHDPKYEQIYRNALEYYKNRPDLKERWELKEAKKLKGDIAKTSPFAMAKRKMMSTFVIDLWCAMRRIKGLPLNEGSYAEGKLGIHHGYDHIPALVYPDGEPETNIEGGIYEGTW